MPKLVLDDVLNITTATATFNSNSAKVETAFENTLSRDGTTPNQMNADLDMNGNDVLNIGDLVVDGVRLTTLIDDAAIATAAASSATASAAAAFVSETNAAASADSAEASANAAAAVTGIPTTVGQDDKVLKVNGEALGWETQTSDDVTFTPAGTGAIASTVQAKLREGELSVFDFLTAEEKADVEAYTKLLDVSTNVQKAIDEAIATGKKLWVPSGIYRCDSPLFLGSWSGTAWVLSTVDIEGFKSPSTSATSSVDGAVFYFTDVDLPGFVIESTRAVSLKKLCIAGQNQWITAMGAWSGYDWLLTEDFLHNSCRDTRYSPHAGIVIDAFGTTTPADGGYTGYTARYNKANNGGSSWVRMEDVVLMDWVVGLLVTPNGTTANAENILFDKSQIVGTKYGISIGQSQSRNILVRDLNLFGSKYGVTTLHHGLQTGSNPGIHGGNIGGTKFVFALSAAQEPAYVADVYTEAIGSLGWVGSSTFSGPIPALFKGCTFDFHSFTTSESLDFTIKAFGPVHFDCCNFSYSAGASGDRPFRFASNGRIITFSNCGLQNESATKDKPLSWNENSAMPIVFDYCRFTGANDGYRTVSQNHAPRGLSAISRTFGLPNMTIADTNATATTFYRQNSRCPNVSLGSLDYTVVGDGTATLTVTDGTILRVGDSLWNDTGITTEKFDETLGDGQPILLGVISAISGNDITLKYVPINAVSATGATIVLRWLPRVHLATTGNTTSGSAEIVNVTNPTHWAAGDRVIGSGIPSGAYVVSVVSTTMTISHNATATATGVRLYDANLTVYSGTAV
jgi:hypothetical protein